MATVTIGSTDFDVFADSDFADDYLLGDVLRAAAWELRNDTAKGRGLVSATRMLLTLPWLSEPAPMPADAEINGIIQQVCAMLASDLLEDPSLFADASGATNIKMVKAGSAQVEFFSPLEGVAPLPLAIWNKLAGANLVGAVNDFDDLSPELGGIVPFGTSDGGRATGGRYPWDWPIADEDYG